MDPVIGLDIAKGESQVQAFFTKERGLSGSLDPCHVKTSGSLCRSIIRDNFNS